MAQDPTVQLVGWTLGAVGWIVGIVSGFMQVKSYFQQQRMEGRIELCSSKLNEIGEASYRKKNRYDLTNQIEQL